LLLVEKKDAKLAKNEGREPDLDVDAGNLKE
jgi:hypothetical protein